MINVTRVATEIENDEPTITDEKTDTQSNQQVRKLNTQTVLFKSEKSPHQGATKQDNGSYAQNEDFKSGMLESARYNLKKEKQKVKKNQGSKLTK